MSKHYHFEQSLDDLRAYHRPQSRHSGGRSEREYVRSHFTGDSTVHCRWTEEQESQSLRRELETLKSMFLDKTDQLLQMESLFRRALNQLSFEIDSLEERRNHFSLLEARLSERLQPKPPSFPQAPTARSRSPGDFSFSQFEGDDTSHFSFGDFDENVTVHVPYNNKDSLEFEDFLYRREGSAPSSVRSERLLEDHNVIYLPLLCRATNKFPFKIGEILAEKYRIECMIASTNFSTVLECHDLETKKQVCLKVIHDQKESFDQGLDEIKIMKLLADNTSKLDKKCIVKMTEFFYASGHLVIVYELLGENLYMVLSNPTTLSLVSGPNLKRVTRQVLRALAYIHSLNIIHADVKPENILVNMQLRKNFSMPEAVDFRLVDFGSSCFVTDELTTYIQSKAYRAPEVLVGAPYGTKIDLWSLGCVIGEIITGEPLFLGDTVPEMLAKIHTCTGEIPKKGKMLHMFVEGDSVIGATSAGKTLQEITGDDELLLDFMRKLLCVDPDERITAVAALSHPWLR